MPYRFLEEAFTADVGFIASGATREECFTAAAAATLEVMLANAAALRLRERRGLHVEHEALDLALLKFLEELIYHKDTEQLLLRPTSVRIMQQAGRWVVDATLEGERIDPIRHELSADVKAVTLHRLDMRRTNGGWEATVVLDV
ncbi:MAG TPA: archease [Candidatus Binatia bacterium]|jgi:SHS2 domain-containing protein